MKAMGPTGYRKGEPERRAKVQAVKVGGALPDPASHVIQLPNAVALALGMPRGDEVRVQAGANTTLVMVQWSDGSPLLRPGAAVARELALTPGLTLRLRYQPGDNTLHLGPFVGILALRARRGPLFGEHSPFFHGLTRQGRRLAIPAFVFSPRDVDWRQGRIGGFVAGMGPSGGLWHRHMFPVPDVIYDRVQTRRAEANPRYREFRQQLKGRVRHWFNESGFFDKWSLHTLLMANDRLRPFLPETRRLFGLADVEHMLHAYPTVFAKPVAGSLGLGIVKITRQRIGYVLRYEVAGAAVVRTVHHPKGVHRGLTRLAGTHPYILQQGLPLARWRGRTFDIRILLQRDGKGQWAVTKMFSRLAARGGITSNLTRGGEACNIHVLLRGVYGGRGRGPMYQKLRTAGLMCAQEIAASLPGPVGELGLDLGLTRGGRVWLIEANSKPFLQMTRDAGSARSLALSVRRPLEFAAHLAGY